MAILNDETAAFDVRSVNLTKITKPIDLRIIIEECSFAIDQIKRQKSEPGFGGLDWRKAADAALIDIENKKRLAAMKLVVVEAETTRLRERSPEDRFSSRFVEVAKAILPPDTYAVVFEAAGRRAA